MERGPMALFGAIVAIGLGPALWLGAQFAQAAPLPVAPPPATANYDDSGTLPIQEALPPDGADAGSGTRILPAGPPARGHGGAADPVVPKPSVARTTAPKAVTSPKVNASPSASASPTRSASPPPVERETTPSPAPPAVDQVLPGEPDDAKPVPFERPSSTAVLAAR